MFGSLPAGAGAAGGLGGPAGLPELQTESCNFGQKYMDNFCDKYLDNFRQEYLNYFG